MAKVPIEAAGILSRLAEMFFKGLDKLLDSAIEYQNDNGILRGTTIISVVDSDDEDREFAITLSPVEGEGNIREGTFIVNFKCDGIDDLNTEVDGIDYENAAVVIDKSTQKKFEEIVNKIIKQNGLSKSQPKDEKDEEEDDSNHSQTHRIDTKNKQGAKVVVTVRIHQITGRNRYDVEIEADSSVESTFKPKEVTGADKLAETIYEWLEKNDLAENISDSDDEWLQSIRTWDDNEDIESSKKINMTLRKSITANEEVVDLVKIYASYNLDDAMVAVDSVLDSDEFLKGLQEGDTNLVIIDEGDELDVQETDESVDPIEIAMMLLGMTRGYQDAMYRFSLSRTMYELSGALNCIDYNWATQDIMTQLGQFIMRMTNSIPVVPDTPILPSIELTPQSSTLDKLKYSAEVMQAYYDALLYSVNIDYEPFTQAAKVLISQLEEGLFNLTNAINSGDYGSAVIGQPLVIQQDGDLI